MKFDAHHNKVEIRAVSKFAQSLRQAIFDRKIESVPGQAVRYYYDADILTGILLGVRDAVTAADLNETQELVRALRSTGFLGDAHVLRTHALELFSQLDSAAKSTGRWSDELRSYIASTGVPAALDDIRKAIDESPVDGHQTDAILRVMTRHGRKTFVTMVAAAGSAVERYSLLQLRLDGLGPEIEILLNDPMTHHVYKELCATRPKGRRNNFRDAAAITSLVRLIREFDENSPTFVRFYTETQILRRYFKSPAVRELLSYRNSVDDDLGFVVRDGLYLILRATIPALQCVGLKVAAGARGVDRTIDTLESLDDVSKALMDLVRLRNERTLREGLRELSIGGRPLTTVITHLTDLYFLDSCLLRYDPPQALQALMPAIWDLYGFRDSHFGEIDSRMLEHLTNAHRELQESVGGARRTFRNVHAIRERADELRRKVADIDFDPLRDLGLIRWGVDLPLYLVEDIRILTRRLRDEDILDRDRAAAELASRMEAVTTIDQCTAVAGLLWFLRMYDEAADTIKRFQDSLPVNDSVPPLETMRCAAAMHARRLTSHAEVNDMLRQLWQRGQSLGREEHARFLLGYGYVAFYAWRNWSVVRPDGSRHTDDAVVRDWGRKSFQAASGAVSEFQRGSLLWAFAVNHCLYVGCAIDEAEELVKPFLGEMLALSGDSILWHYRFDDTMAYYYLRVVQREMASASGSISNVGNSRRWCANLRFASKFLARIPRRLFQFDPEIKEHGNSVDALRLELNCVQLLGRQSGS